MIAGSSSIVASQLSKMIDDSSVATTRSGTSDDQNSGVNPIAMTSIAGEGTAGLLEERTQGGPRRSCVGEQLAEALNEVDREVDADPAERRAPYRLARLSAGDRGRVEQPPLVAEAGRVERQEVDRPLDLGREPARPPFVCSLAAAAAECSAEHSVGQSGINHPAVPRNLSKIIGTMYEDARDVGLVEANPFSNLRLPVMEKTEEIQAPTLEEYRRLLDACTVLGGHGTEFRAMIQFAAWTGIRAGELHAMQWDDGDGDCVWVRRSRGTDAEAGRLRAATTRLRARRRRVR